MKVLTSIPFLILPIIFSILGGLLFEQTQKIPRGEWELLFNNQFEKYGLDSKPNMVMSINGLVKTGSGNIYQCEFKNKTCEIYKSEEFSTEDVKTLKVSHGSFPLTTPHFDGLQQDIVEIQVVYHETIFYEYYLVASDGSIWHWSRGDNIYNDIVGWTVFGLVGGIFGIFVARLTSKVLKKQ